MSSLCGHDVFRTRLLSLVRTLQWVLLAVCVASPTLECSAVEERFALLQVGAQTYRNVTVTTKDKNYIFIMHAAGMSNIKIAELTPQVRERLGYQATLPEHGKKRTSAASAWAKSTLAKIELPHLKNLPHSLVAARAAAAPSNLPPNILLTAAAIGLGSFLLFCYCSM